MSDWTPQEIVQAVDGLSVLVISILALAYTLGKWADAAKARWSK